MTLASPVRKDFPILCSPEGEKNLVFLDSAATTQKPEAVIQRLSDYYRYENTNIHRGSYPLSLRAERCFEQARRTVQQWLGAPRAEEILFTKSATESLNLLAHSVLAVWANPGDNVVVTELEHASNYYPYREQCRIRGLEFRVAPVHADGTLDLTAMRSLIDGRTKLVSITAMSNVTGLCPELPPLIQLAHGKGALVSVDASQAVAHHRMNVEELGCDFLSFSGHKLYGPMGCGVLYGRAGLLERMPAFLWGGGMLERGTDGLVIYRDAPGRFEAGTPNLEAVLGLAAAIEYLEEKDFSFLLTYERELSEQLLEGLKAVPGLCLHGPESISPIVTFSMKGYGAYDVGTFLGAAGVSIRCGAHCAYPLMERMGLESSCRVSLGIYNDSRDLDLLTERLKELGRRGYVRRGKTAGILPPVSGALRPG